MLRSGNKFLLILLLLAGTVPLTAFYYFPDHKPPGPPPNYTPIDPSAFYGIPPLSNLSPGEMDRYFIYFDSVLHRWTINTLVPVGSSVVEQFHGSVLVQMESEPELGVNVWPDGFDLTDDLHRNDRWGWVKWPDSIAPDLYEIWWDITIGCPNPYAGCTHTIGYWKNHTGLGPQPDAVSPHLPVWLGTPGGDNSILVGDVTDAVNILKMKTETSRVDGYSKLFAQLLGVKLSIASGAVDESIRDVVANVDAFIAENDWRDWYKLDKETQQMVLGWKDTLDDYNNGLIGPGHCDEDSTAVDCNSGDCPPCVIGMTFAGCAFDFNIWASSYTGAFDADRIYLGQQMLVLAHLAEYADAFDGIYDGYGHPFAGTPEPNLSLFSMALLPGESYNADGLIIGGDEYGNTYGGSFAYEGNGIQFSVYDCDNNPPTFDPPVGYMKPLSLCPGTTIYDTIVANDFDAGEFVTITHISGPGQFTSTPGAPPVYGYYSWTPTDPGSYAVVFRATDSQGASVIDSIVYQISINAPPIIIAADTAVFSCWGFDEICYTVPVDNAGGDQPVFSLLSGPGAIDPATGRLCFNSGGAGTYDFTVAAAGSCGADTASFTITVTTNSDPWINRYDTVITLCNVGTVCFDVAAFDPDPDDSLEITLWSGAGEFTQTGNGTGYHCFTPENVENARYVFYFAVTDNCWREATYMRATPPAPPIDSIVVVVQINQPPVIFCPGDLSPVLCSPDSVCFDIEADDPDGDPLTFKLLSDDGRIDSASGHLCLYAVFGGTYPLEVEVTDDCGNADTCSFTVTVEVNQPPVISVADTVVELCALEEVCIPFEMYDPDDNIVKVTVRSSRQEFVVVDGTVCFTPPGPGTYGIILTATDSCGLAASDTAQITVALNTAPSVSVTDSMAFICGPTEVCLPVTAFDSDGMIDSIVAMDPAYYNEADQTVCLTVSEPGAFAAAVVVYDDCGATASAIGEIVVMFNRPPSVTAPPDTAVFACAPGEICLEGFDITDADDNIAQIEFFPNLGTYADGRYCFTPDTAGNYCFVVIVTDLCGESTEDTVCVTYETGVDVAITCPDQVPPIALCGPDSVCLDIPVTPAGSAVTVLEPGGVYTDGRFCFYADTSGVYVYTLVAEGDCGADTCQVFFDITIEEPPQVTCPPTQAIHLCGPDWISLPLAVSPASAVVTVTPDAEYADGMVTFYAAEPGEYCFEVTAATDCGSDTCSFCVTVTFDSPPTVEIADSTVFLCKLEQICIPFSYDDPDGNIDRVIVQPIAYRAIDSSICFTPYSAGEYELIVTVTDSCKNLAVDTAIITVVLNQGPTASIDDTTVFICEATDVCLPLTLFDPEGIIDSVVVADPAYYDADNGEVCLPVTQSGTYDVVVRVYDGCGVSALDSAVVTVMLNGTPTVTLPDDTSIFLCQPEPVCIPAAYDDPDGNIAVISILPPEYELVDGSICFTPPDGGLYDIILTVTDSCGLTASDTVTVTIDVNLPPTVSVGSAEAFICGPTELCLPVTMSDPEGEISSVYVAPPAYYDADRQAVCLTVEVAGSYDVSVEVFDACGASAISTGTLTVTANSAPGVKVPPDTTILHCVIEQICLTGFEFSDIDGNIASIEFSPDLGTYADGQYCFTPDTAGEYCLVARVTDSCGLVAEDTVCVTYRLGDDVAITCPGEVQNITLCTPDSVCADIPVTPASAEVTVLEPGAVYEDGRLCFFAAASGTYTFTLVATGQCGADTCQAVFAVTIEESPQVSCPTPDPIHLCGPDSISVPLGVVPASAVVTVTPPAVYAEGMLTFFAESAGEYCFEVIADTDCGSDTCSFCVTVTFDSPPQVTIADTSLFMCELEQVCLPYTYSDPDDNVVKVTVSPLKANVADGQVCFMPPGPGTHEIVITVTDACGLTDSDTATVNIALNQNPLVTVGDTLVFLCEADEICLSLTVSDPDGKIDSVVVAEPAYYNPDNQTVCLMVNVSGTYQIPVTVYDDCGASTLDVGWIFAAVNVPPVVTAPNDTAVFQCTPQEICLNPFQIADANNNITTIEVLPEGLPGTFVDNHWCFLPDTSGTYCIIIRATDECGEMSEDTACLTYTLGDEIVIDCPAEVQTADLCAPESLCVDIPISPAGAAVSILEAGAVYDNGRLCFFADQTGIYEFTVVAAADCGADTCTVTFDVTVDEPPVITCPPSEPMHLCDPGDVTLPMPITPSWAQVLVSPGATWVDGILSFNAPEAGEYCFEIIANTACGSDTCNVCITVTIDSPPVVDIADSTIFLCEIEQVCIPFSYSDPDGNIDRVITMPITYKKLDSTICFTPWSAGEYELIVTVTDSCYHVTADTAIITIVVNQEPQVAVGDTALFMCGPGEVCLPVTVSDFEDMIDRVEVSAPAYYNAETGTVCMPVGQSGDHEIIVTVYDHCGAAATDTGVITATINAAPYAELPPDTALSLCEPQKICFPVVYGDPDGNLRDVLVEPPGFNLYGDSICFDPYYDETYEVIFSVGDSCGVTAADTMIVSIIMNQVPTVTVGDTALLLCGPADICLPVTFADSDGIIDSVIVSAPAYYDQENETVCLPVDAAGDYDVTVTVYDDCGASASDLGNISVTFNGAPVVSLPADTSLTLCIPEEICFPVNISDPDNNIVDIIAEPAEFTLIDGTVCFTPEMGGLYQVIVRAVDDCGLEAVDTMAITVSMNQFPLVTVGDTTVFACAAQDICLPVSASDPDGAIDSIVVAEPAYYNDVDGTICLPVFASGTYSVIVTAYDDCGAATVDTGTITATLNTGPTVSAPADTAVFQCTPGEICLSGFNIGDVDDNIATIEFIPNPGTYTDGTYCFTPAEAGQYCLIVRVTDECGAVAEDTVCVTYDLAEEVAITCPDGVQNFSLCSPDSICVDVPVTPASATVTILEPGAVYADGRLCMFADASGTYDFTMIAEDVCGADTCLVVFNVALDQAPQITCPPSDTLHLCDPGPVSVPMGILPATAQVTITPPATYADGILTFTAEAEGEYCFEVIAANDCGADTCNFCYTITIDSPPQVTIADTAVFLCGLDEICVPYDYSDPDDNVVSVTVEPKRFVLTEGFVCVTPAQAGTTNIVLTVTDSCGHSVSDTATIVVTLNQGPVVDADDTTVFICEPADVCVPVTAFDADGSIDSIVAAAPAYYNDINGTVCLPASAFGFYEVEVAAYDDCGAVAYDTAIITVLYNSPPQATAPADTAFILCGPTEVCLTGFDFADDDNNIVQIEVTPPLGTYADGSYCFTPDTEGSYCFIARAIDACGASGEDTVCVTISWGQSVAITCPEGVQSFTICEPDTVCLDIPVTPIEAKVTILEPGGYYLNGSLCFDADTAGTYIYTMIAEGDCDADTCTVEVAVTMSVTPQISCPQPDPVHLCGADSVSIPLAVMPATAEITITPPASFADGMMTFYAEKEGEYCFEVTASNLCGADTCNFCILVEFDSPPEVTVPDTSTYICSRGDICIPVNIFDEDNNIVTIDIQPDGCSLIDGTICFPADTTGTYDIIVTVTDSCGFTVTDTGTVVVTLNQGPSVAVADSSIFVCQLGEVCIPVDISDPDGHIDSILVDEPAYYDADNQQVCFLADSGGSYEIVVAVCDDCGECATDSGLVVVIPNAPPTISFDEYPDTLRMCDLVEICLPISVGDVDGNIASVVAEATCGEASVSENHDFVCVIPTGYGPCTITAVVVDDCDEVDTAIAEIVLIPAALPDPPCPDDDTVIVCDPGEVCVELGQVKPGSNITVRPDFFTFMPEIESICYLATVSRVDTVTVIDSTECGKDSCRFVLTTIMNRPPVVTAQEPDAFVFCRDTTLCVDYTVTDPDNNQESVTIGGSCPGAVLDAVNHKVCLDIAAAIDCVLDIIVTDECGLADTVSVAITATPNRPPQISFPIIQTVVRCESDTMPVVIADICVTDPDYDEVVMSLDSGLGDFAFDALFDCGELTFTPPTNDTSEYCFKFLATDACDTVTGLFCINVLPSVVCSTCVEVAIEGPSCVSSGGLAAVTITAKTVNDIAAYDLLIGYDASALNILHARLGSAIPGWEYFTYRFGDEDCTSPCLSGLIRLVAIADINNGPFHPPADQLHPEGALAEMTFRVTSDLNFGGQRIPVKFFWNECGDNGFSDPTGQYLLVDHAVYSVEGNIDWDEFNDDVYPEWSRPPHVGTPDSCLTGDKYEPLRCVSFRNGDVCIQHPDSIDARGDLNLNGVQYEIADAVVYTNYFIIGLKAFTVSPAAQIAASDVNADGMTLSIADLVHLIRIIVGDASPYPRKERAPNPATVACTRAGDEVTASINSAYDIGAALLVFNIDGVLQDDPVLADGAADMDMKSGLLDGQLRVLIYSFQLGARIPSGQSDLVRISVPLGCTLELVQVDAADYYGRALNVEIGNTRLPRQLELSQNYPNPFNPNTMFDLALPAASDYVVTIYNITGQIIKRWTGSAEAGYVTFEWNGRDDNGRPVASGIYFYRAQAAGSEAIRKMVLLK